MNKSQIAMNAKCDLIEEMGFRVEHEDRRVSWKGFHFNFSGVESNRPAIFEAAMRQMWRDGHDTGKQNMQQDFRNLLGIQEQQE